MDFDFFGPQEVQEKRKSPWTVVPDTEDPEIDMHMFDPEGLDPDEAERLYQEYIDKNKIMEHWRKLNWGKGKRKDGTRPFMNIGVRRPAPGV